MKSFKHKASHFECSWDLQYLLMCVDNIKYIKDKHKKQICNVFINHYKNILLPIISNNGYLYLNQ